jgi:hypothetical protein
MIIFKIDLDEYSSKKPRIIRLLIYGAFICLSLIAISFSISLAFRSYFENLLFITSIYLALYIYFAWITFKTKLFVRADDKGIVFKFGYHESSKNFIFWDSINGVRIGYAYITFYKKSGKQKRIQLGWLPYSKVLEIKEKFIEICESKGITYEIVDFIKYPKLK